MCFIKLCSALISILVEVIKNITMDWDNDIRNIRHIAKGHLNKNGNSMVQIIFGFMHEDKKDIDYTYPKTCHNLIYKIQAIFQNKFPFFGYFLICLRLYITSEDYSNCKEINSITIIPSYNNERVNVFFILFQDIELFSVPTVCRDVVVFDPCKQNQTSDAYCNYNLHEKWTGSQHYLVTAGSSRIVNEWTEDDCQTWHKAGEKQPSKNFKVKVTFQICP